MEAQLEYVCSTRCIYACFARLAPICILSLCLLTKFLHRSSVRSLSRVRCWWSLPPPCLPPCWLVGCIITTTIRHISKSYCTSFLARRGNGGERTSLFPPSPPLFRKNPRAKFQEDHQRLVLLNSQGLLDPSTN